MSPAPLGHARLGAATLALGAASMLLAVYALHSALPENPIRLPFAKTLEVRAWLPEGWAFFTAPAQSDQRVPYVRTSGTWAPASAGPNARAQNAFGLRRTARVQNLEIEALVEQVPKAAWAPCEGAPETCFDAVHEPVVVQNRSARPSLCGDVAIPVHKPVPWAWSELPRTFFMPSRFVRMVVQC